MLAKNVCNCINEMYSCTAALEQVRWNAFERYLFNKCDLSVEAGNSPILQQHKFGFNHFYAIVFLQNV